ncbi:MAG: hypothetical protein ACXW1U_14290, partial [Methylobacter sp.]
VRDFSWLPVCGFIVLAVGLLECFDAVIAKELGDFFLNLQNGVFYVSGTEEQLAGQTQNYLKVDLPQGLTILAYGRDPPILTVGRIPYSSITATLLFRLSR